jgi:hypothetical protein
LRLDLQILKRYSSSWWHISFGWIDVLQQKINLIRRFLSDIQTPDSVITPFHIANGTIIIYKYALSTGSWAL